MIFFQKIRKNLPTLASLIFITLSIQILPAATFISQGATWEYLDDGIDQGTGWSAPAFNDTAWASGPAELGFGEGDEQTTLNNHGGITYYFRHTFNVPSTLGIDMMGVSIKSDDGFVMYLNGNEVLRHNMPAGAVNFNTTASNGISNYLENNFHGFNIPSTDLQTGTNVLAVEIHQINNGSSDISFNMELTSTPHPLADIIINQVETGFSRPLLVTHAGDGSDRLFVVEQRGLIRIVKNGTVEPTPFLNVSTLVHQSHNEGGLLGLAFHPNYTSNGKFYISYTQISGGDSIISEYTVSANPDIANAGSEQIIMGPINQPQSNHNGGHIAFSPIDNYLYIGMGDGGGADDDDAGHGTIGNGQDTATTLGTILRIDIDSATPYAVPITNPFAVSGGVPEIFAYGLRNPWRFSFDQDNGRLFCGDVGQNVIEEIDIIINGGNYGWRCFEGSIVTPGIPHGANCTSITHQLPIEEYSHTGGFCSITGGYIYRGSTYTFNGYYFYADYCSGDIWALYEHQPNTWRSYYIAQLPFGVTSFGEDEQGNIYIVQGTSIFRIDGTPAPPSSDPLKVMNWITF